MGYNLSAGCHTHQVHRGALRGEEGKLIKGFAREHPKPCVREVRVDNGWSKPEDEFPQEWEELRPVDKETRLTDDGFSFTSH